MIGQCQTDVGQEATRQHIDFFLAAQLNGVAQCILRFACIVTGNHFNFAAQQATRCIDFFNRQLPTLLIGLGELRNGGITVDFANSNWRLGACRQSSQR